MKQFYDIIKRPIITEKSQMLNEWENKVIFEVDRRANKVEIARAVEELFDVKVLKVNTHTLPGKVKNVGRSRGHTSIRKRAVVTLADGDTIEFYEGV